jgi:large subunit ribosomal protein L7/L12
MTTTNLDKIVEQLSSLTIIEVNKLVSILEEKWGVSASSMPMMSAAVTNASQDNSKSVQKENFDVFLESAGTSKIAVIKLVREICELTLKDAKLLVDKAPIVVKKEVAKNKAEELQQKFKDVGATVQLK